MHADDNPADSEQPTELPIDGTLDLHMFAPGEVKELVNEYLEVWYPPGRTTVTHGMYMFEEIMPARQKYEALFGNAPTELLVIRIAHELEPYKEETGREWWCYSEMRGDTLIFVPVYTLYKRGISPIAVPHEYYQWAIRKRSGSQPRLAALRV